MVARYEPMLATQWAEPFDHPDWEFEVKWDGFRTIAYVGPGGTSLRSRRGLDLAGRFPEVAGMRFRRDVVVDGEIVAFGDNGVPSFHLLGYRPANFVAFDLLFDGEDLCARGLEERRSRLADLSLPAPAVASELVPEDGLALFEAVKARGMEGIVAKRNGSTYQPGVRSPDWRKIAVWRRGRAVVGGYLAGDRSRAKTFGSLLLGLWKEDGLHFIGAVGTGFSDSVLADLRRRLDALTRPGSPFASPVEVPGHKTWVEPNLVAEIEFREWTPYDHLRAPVFKGLGDVDSGEVTWESEGPTSQVPST
jgi:bifunctional non-homologous end joining protein LigD